MNAGKQKIKNETKNMIKNGDVVSINNPRGFFWRYFSFRSKAARRFYIFVLTVVAMAALLSYNYTPNIGIELGQPSPRTVKANKDIQFEDPLKTEEDKEKNAAQVEDVYFYDPEVLNGREGVLYQIRYLFILSQLVNQKEEQTFEEKVSYLTNLSGDRYPELIIQDILNLEIDDNRDLMNETINIAKDMMGAKIKPTEVDFIKSEIPSILQSNDNISQKDKSLIVSVLQNNLEPTAVFDPDATEKAKEQAKFQTSPHMISILEGQIIVQEGEIVEDGDVIMLQKLGLFEPEVNWTRYLYILLIIIVVMVMLALYLQKYDYDIYNNLRKILIISFFLVVFTGIIKGFTTLATVHLNLWNYLFPIIAVSMLVTVIFNTRLGIVITICLSIFAGVATNQDFSLAIAYLIGGIFSTYLVSNVSQRAQLMKGGFISSLILGFLFFTINLFSSQPSTIALYTALGVLNGIICAVLTIGLMPFLESVFKIVTAMGLLELSHTDQPLLKEMLIRAPGTYNHSLLVSHLSENAAKAIGADSLLVKVAALYHDLGKLKRPEYFYENQGNMENVHDKLNPSMSKNIIASHLRDGIDSAIKNKLPRRVIKVISQHHGTSLMSYFYEKQKDRETIKTSNGASESVESHFRYQTKRPQNKEAAILMLADSAEAAVRSIEDMTPKKIEQMVAYIVDNKINDGQLNEANITLKDINIIKQNLIEGLVSLYHSRLTYPGTDIKVEAKQ